MMTVRSRKADVTHREKSMLAATILAAVRSDPARNCHGSGDAVSVRVSLIVLIIRDTGRNIIWSCSFSG